MALKMLQYNIQSINKIENKNILELFLENEKIDIALLIETWVGDETSTNLCNYNFYGKKEMMVTVV